MLTHTPRSFTLTHTNTKFFISTSTSLFNRAAIQSFYASPEMHWSTPMPSDALEVMLQNSLVLGLYAVRDGAGTVEGPGSGEVTFDPEIMADEMRVHSSADIQMEETEALENLKGKQLQQVGMARLVTDACTLAYLTDVFVLPGFQGRGLGTWLVQCCQQVIEGFPWFKGVMLLAHDGERERRFYEKTLGCETWTRETEKREEMVWMKRWVER